MTKCKEINYLQNKLDLHSLLDVDLNFQQLKERQMKTLAAFSGSFTVSSFIRREGICSVTCTFPVSRFVIFHVFILLSDLAISLIMLFLASCVTLLRILQFLM
jgi:hypothetical protein